MSFTTSCHLREFIRLACPPSLCTPPSTHLSHTSFFTYRYALDSVPSKGPHCRSSRISLSLQCLEAHTNNKTRTFIEGYHFGKLWSRRKVVRFITDIPINESSSNLRYVDMKSNYSRTSTSRSVHESRVHVGQDMFLVSGYWDPKADVNRSLFSFMKIIWRGELSVVRAGRFVPYCKRMKHGQKADLAVKRYVTSFSKFHLFQLSRL